MDPCRISTLKTTWEKEGFRPRKDLGQNFLIDRNIREKIMDNIPSGEEWNVLEIGPGFGVMTFSLAEKCKRVFAVEKDQRIHNIMLPLFLKRDNIEPVNTDALDVDICRFRGRVPSEKLMVYGNIPYNISTPLIEKAISQRGCIDTIYFVIQKELAQRITSGPGSRDCGSISLFVRYFCAPSILMKISKGCFYPRPKVDSCLLELKVRNEPPVASKDPETMFRVIRCAFSQRRKKAVNPLGACGPSGLGKQQWSEIFKKCGIDPSIRAEQMGLEQYARLTDQLVLQSRKG